VVAGTLPPVGAVRLIRTDVEGLRAVAVGLVLLYHAGVTGVPGGYVGVDVFFVVSGYLITALLLREREATGTIRLREFYARRLRRLLPAATLVVVATVVAARVLLPPLLVDAVATDGVWAATWLANLRFVLIGTDYLAAEGAESPLLHFWSLAVEEQFYLVWPLLVLAVARGRRPHRLVALTVAVVLATSLVASVVLTRTSPVVAYLAPHTRAWELAVGAALALAAARGVRLPARAAAVVSWAGLVAIVVAGVTFTDATPFPGWTALLPVLGAAAIVLAGEHDDRTGAGAILRHRPLQSVGRASYSLYLWHWPVLVLGGHALGGEATAAERVGLLALSGVLAWATLRLVEDPVRHAGVLRLPVRSVALGGALVATSVVGAVAVAASVPDLTGRGPAPEAGPVAADPGTEWEVDRFIDRQAPRHERRGAEVEVEARLTAAVEADLLPATLQPPLTEATATLPAIYADGCFAGWDGTTSGPCTYGSPGEPESVVLFGDSKAAQWFPALEALATDHGWELTALAKPSCPSIDIVVGKRGAPYPECATWRESSFARIVEEQPDVVVLSNAGGYPAIQAVGERLDTDRIDHVAEGTARVIERIRSRSPDTRVLLVGDSASPGFDVPVCLSEHLDDIDACWADPDEAVAVDLLAAQREVAERTGAVFVDPTPWLCTDQACPVVVEDLLVYFDDGHLSPPFVRSLAPLLDPVVREVVAGGEA
jgi:peptidoglycan/LPS O-acetylase OafA/YrhL